MGDPAPQAVAHAPPTRHRSRGGGFTLRSSGFETGLALTGLALRSAGRGLAAAVARPFRGPEDRLAAREELLIAIARDAARVLGRLKGPFAKAGQFASLRADLLPAPARRALAELREAVPALPFEAIRAPLEAELGGPVDRIFGRFDREPLAAASIAQVHRAALENGREVVVKIQYPWLLDSRASDLAWLRRVFRVLARVLPIANPEQLLEEFTAGLDQELDFRQEARAATRMASNLADDPRILVPEVHQALSTSSVLVLDYHERIDLRDVSALERLGTSPAEVMEILGRAYARQVFVDGFFHADPHTGNLYVVAEPERAGGPRVLFLDFGLSRQLDAELRDEMRGAIHALLQGRVAPFVDAMLRLGMVAPGAEPAVRAAVERMFARLRGEADAPLALGVDRVLALKDEARDLLRDTPGLQLPADLLLYAKTVSYLFGLSAEVAPELDLTRVMVPSLLRFLAQPASGPLTREVSPRPPESGVEAPGAG